MLASLTLDVITTFVCNTGKTNHQMNKFISLYERIVSVDLRIYRAFFAHTRYEMRKDDNRERGSNEHKEATRKKYNKRERRSNEHREAIRKWKV
jgi:hypothetical protein